MNSIHSAFSKEQRIHAIQRLTALWAFTESGLGGIMHALQIPFTGLVVGGMAVIMICVIAVFSDRAYKQILKSVMVVLIVKAIAAPLTPATAYLAVSFQALLGFLLFSLLQVNFISILLLSIIAMLESAMQKLLVLVLFLGQSLWKAIDNMIAFAAKQLGYVITNGSAWIIGIYLFIYVAGGFLVAWFAYRIIHTSKAAQSELILKQDTPINGTIHNYSPAKKNLFKKVWILLFIMLLLSVLLFFFSNNYKQGWIEVIKTVTWTLSAMLLWFVLLGPLLTKTIQKLLKQKERRYSNEISIVLSLLPVLSKITNAAWQQSRVYRGFKKWNFFFKALIFATLTWVEPDTDIQQSSETT